MDRKLFLVDQDALSATEAREWMVEIGRRVYEKGFVAANDGNFSMKLRDGTFFCTPTGVSKGFMSPDMICRIDADMNVLEAQPPFKPSSEILMHLDAYRKRADIKAVVHAHPPYATAFACINRPLQERIMPEAIIHLGRVPVTRYGTPSTDEIPEAIAPYLENHDAVLLQNHGALSVGADLQAAYYRMEGIEFYAMILCRALDIGGGKVGEIGGHDLEKLLEMLTTFSSGRNPLAPRPAGSSD